MTDLLQFAINVRNSTVNVSAHCNSCAKIACGSSQLIFMFLYAGSKIQSASQQFVWSRDQPCFCKLRFASKPTSENLTELGVEIQTALSW